MCIAVLPQVLSVLTNPSGTQSCVLHLVTETQSCELQLWYSAGPCENANLEPWVHPGASYPHSVGSYLCSCIAVEVWWNIHLSMSSAPALTVFVHFGWQSSWTIRSVSLFPLRQQGWGQKCFVLSHFYGDIFIFYASLARLLVLSNRTWPRSWCDAHLGIDELFQRERACLSKQLCNVWAAAAPRYAWVEGEQCQWPCKSRYFVFLLLLFFLESNRGAGIREQKNNVTCDVYLNKSVWLLNKWSLLFEFTERNLTTWRKPTLKLLGEAEAALTFFDLE